MSGANAYSIGRVIKSLRWFAVGKIVSAPLSFLLVLLLTAKLPTAEYAAYVAAIAVLEIGVAVGTMGIDWLTQTAVVGIRVRGSARQVQRVVLMLASLALVPYALLAGLLWLAAPWLSSAMGSVASAELLRMYAIVLLIEGTTRMHRDNLLAVLMMQSAVQVSQLTRVLSMLAGVGALSMTGIVFDSIHVAWIEITASLLSMVVTVVLLARHSRPDTDAPAQADIGLKRFFGREQIRFALNAYGSFMLTILISAEVTTALIARYLGAESVAIFGFIWKLLETGRRLLPMDLFYGVIRPATIGRFESSAGDRGALVRDSNLFLKANLLVLGAGMAIALGVGDWLVETLSKGNVMAPPLLMAALLTTAYGHSLRRTVELIAFVSGHSDLFLKASLSCVLSPLLLFVLLSSPYGNLYLVALTLIGVDVIFSSVVIGGLRLRFDEMRIDFSSWLKVFLASGLGGAAATLVNHLYPMPAGMAIAGGVAAAVYMAVVVISAGLTRTELDYVRYVIRSRPS